MAPVFLFLFGRSLHGKISVWMAVLCLHDGITTICMILSAFNHLIRKMYLRFVSLSEVMDLNECG